MNTNIDALYPEFWAAAFDDLDIGKYELQNRVSRKVESLVAQAGDTVTVPITPDMGDADDWVPGATITATAVTQETKVVTLDKSKKKTFALTGKELSMSPYDLIKQYGIPAAKTILKAVNLDIYKELQKTQYLIDAISSFSEDNVIDLKTLLSNNEVSEAGRILVGSPDHIGKMLKLDAFQFAQNSSDGGAAMREGLMGRKFGFDIFDENIISKHTPADLTGAVNGTGFVIGNTALTVDGFADSADKIRAGDVFTIAGDSTVYTVKTTTVSTNTVGLTFTPALVANAADDAVITFRASQALLAFVPGALAFAARPYAVLPGGIGVNSQVVMLRGLPIRISVWHDANLGVNVQYDVLYGQTLVNEKRVTKAITA